MLLAAFHQGSLAAKVDSEIQKEAKPNSNPCKDALLRVEDDCEENFQLPLNKMVYIPSEIYS